MSDSDRYDDAIRVAKMYYYHDMTTQEIAQEINVSRSTVSRLLSFAKREGLVDIHIHDPKEHPHQLEIRIQQEFGLLRAHVVPMTEAINEVDRLERVAQYAASYLNTLFSSNMILGVAWGTTTSAISRYLHPKATYRSQVVQLNGSGNVQTMGIEYASEIIMRFAQNFQSSPQLFPVPAFFDRAATRRAMWEEGSIKRILDLQSQADILLHSIGAVDGGIPSKVHSGEYLKQRDYTELKAANVVGDIATIFYRADGTFHGIPLNERASGPNLELFQKKHGVCVICGKAKLKGLQGALNGKWIKDLIIDEPTARKFVEETLLP